MNKDKQNGTTSPFLLFLKQNETYTPDCIGEIIDIVKPYFGYSRDKNIVYYNIPCAFDIETSSFYDGSEKRAIMYEWTFGIFGIIIIGRTWGEWVTMMDTISKKLRLNDTFRLLCYCHNLAYEFQWFRKWIGINMVFATDVRKPLYVLCDNGIEFRCSYLLSGYSLETLAKNITSVKIRKLTGDLDYSLIRHSETPLTKAELKYCINDVKIVMAYIWERITSDGGIGKIPLTKTGFVRRYCRKNCFAEENRIQFVNTIRELTLTNDEYEQNRRAFQGGFTHCNPFFSGKEVQDVTSFDFTSSYPFCMVAEQYPMSAGEIIEIPDGDTEMFERYLSCYCCIFDLEIFDLESLLLYESYISLSHCWEVEKAKVDNGRLVSAQHLMTTVTNVDFDLIRKFYTWKKIRVYNFRTYVREYLPTPFVKSILDLYKAKTELKGVIGREAEYAEAKEKLNSCYGMTVTSIIRIDYEYDGTKEQWNDPHIKTTDERIQKINDYNADHGRFLYYPWG